MTYEVPSNPQREHQIEAVHNDLATEHGRDNVFVTETDGRVVAVIGDDIGLIDPVDAIIYCEQPKDELNND